MRTMWYKIFESIFYPETFIKHSFNKYLLSVHQVLLQIWCWEYSVERSAHRRQEQCHPSLSHLSSEAQWFHKPGDHEHPLPGKSSATTSWAAASLARLSHTKFFHGSLLQTSLISLAESRWTKSHGRSKDHEIVHVLSPRPSAEEDPGFLDRILLHLWVSRMRNEASQEKRIKCFVLPWEPLVELRSRSGGDGSK